MHCIHTHTHAAMQICLCPLSASECGMQSRSCHCCPPAPLPTLPDDRQPTDRCSACTTLHCVCLRVRVWSAAFVFKRASRKQIICTQHTPSSSPAVASFSPPFLPLTHNKLTAITRFCQHAAWWSWVGGEQGNLRGQRRVGVARSHNLSASPRKL